MPPREGGGWAAQQWALGWVAMAVPQTLQDSIRSEMGLLQPVLLLGVCGSCPS